MIVYTKHALERMLQRRFRKDDVEYCLDNYHTKYSDTVGNSILKAELPGGRNIKVVMGIKGNDEIVIITVAD